MSWLSDIIFGKPAPPPAAPAPPDYSKITRDTLKAQIELAPELFASEANPLYGQLAYAKLQNQINSELMSGQMQQLGRYYPEIAGVETDYQSRLRSGELQQISSPEMGLQAYQKAFNQLTPGYQEAVAGMGELAKSATQQSIKQPTYTAYEQAVGGPSYGQYINQVGGPSADLTLGGMQAYKFGGSSVAPYQSGLYTSNVRGPQMQSGLRQIDTGLVNSYMSQMPGVAGIAQELSQQAQQDLAAGRSLTPEEARLATQSAREAYAARGTALGPQAISAEILNRAELGNQRYRERQAAAAQAAGTISSLYTPALQQAYQRQAGAEAYNLGAQGQQFGQAMSQEELARAAQAQQFGQEITQEDIAKQAQAQEYGQRLGLQEMGLSLQGQQYQQGMGRESLAQQTQNQALQQALQRTQQGIAGRQAMLGLQAQQAQIGASAMGALQGAQTPILQAFYRQPILAGSVANAQQFSLGNQQAAGPALYNPESSMAFQTAFMPYQAGIAERNAVIQGNAMQQAAKTQAMGQMAGGAMSAGAMY